MNRSLISIVVPCFNEAEVIAEAVKRLDRFCDEAIDLQVEIIFVDDGSRDETRLLIEGFAKTNSRINLICLARWYRCRTR
jgi:dolichol-phosphate mannosyltransferase